MRHLSHLPAQPAGTRFFAFYFSVHLIFCSTYTFLLLWWGGWVGYSLLLAIILLTAGWSFRQSNHFRQLGKSLLSPYLVLLACLVAWNVAFPVFLTYRQWLLRH